MNLSGRDGILLPFFPHLPPALMNKLDLWAPDVPSPIGGNTTSTTSCPPSAHSHLPSVIGVTVGESMDVGPTGVTSSRGSSYNSIDGNLTSTSEGCFLSFGSFWKYLYQVPVSSPSTNTDKIF